MMLKYLIFGLICTVSASAHAQVVNYVTPSQAEMGTISGSDVENIVVEEDLLSDLDKIAAERGDTHAMGTLANSCLKKRDYSCAYKWSGIALRGSYWKSIGREESIKDIQNEAAKHLSTEQISDLNIVIKEFKPH